MFSNDFFNHISIMEKCRKLPHYLLFFIRWCFIALITGIVIGSIGAAFVYCIRFGTVFREKHPWVLLGLPLGGLLIVWLYRVTKNHDDRGTNTVLSSLRSENEIPAKMAPLIFISTVITHFFGGSAGREGAALQLGGSIGNILGRCFHLREDEKRILILAGMSAAFSAIFRTPIAAVIFAMEVSCIGMMRYAALVPCTIASLSASYIAEKLGLTLTHYSVTDIPKLSPITGLQTLLLAVLCAVLSIVFCKLLHRTEKWLEKWFVNPYLRIVIAGSLVLLLGLIFQSIDYFGLGETSIHNAIAGKTIWYAFLAKMLFTAITIGGGFKGGEIVPTFFIGATFGCLMGSLIGLSPSLCAALGMIAMFCGVTNCPLASLFIAVELFGVECIPYCMLVVAVSYLTSGYHGLYKEQKFFYSKYSDKKINRS